jgi:hypothetical protein
MVTTMGREPPDDMAWVIDAMRRGEPVRVELLTERQRIWLANTCWSCLKRQADCECIFP